MGGGCHRVRLADGDALVRRHHLRDAHAAIGPLHRHRIDGIAPPDAEGQQVVHARLEAARGLFLLEELLLPAPQRHRRADREPVGALSLELDLEIVVREQRPGVVAIDESFLVDVVDDQVRRPVAVQIPVGRAIGEARRVQSPGGALVGERQVTVVPECVVRQLRRAHRCREFQEVHPLALCGRAHRLVLPQERDVVLRRDVLGEAVRHIDVLGAVQIEVRDEGAPAPVRAGHAGQLADVRERAVAVVEMEHVAGELVVKAVADLGLEAVPVLERRGGLEPVFVFG